MAELVDAIDSKSIVLLERIRSSRIRGTNIIKILWLNNMNIVIALKATILGIIEGLTEYFPVSSTGHLIVFGEFLQFNSIPDKTFEIIIQLGAILAICVVYRHTLIKILLTFYTEQNVQRFIINMIIATLPAIIVGMLAHNFIKTVLFSTTIVAYSLIIGGIIMIIIDKINFTKKYIIIDNIPKNIALKIGLFQCLAMIPGVSRSGATIIGGISLGLSKQTATEFSFFLALPTILGATIYDIIQNDTSLTSHLFPILIGSLAAFISGLIVVSKFIAIIRRFGFTPFGYYRILLGTAILFIL